MVLAKVWDVRALGAGCPSWPFIGSLSAGIIYYQVRVSWVPAELAQRKAICLFSFHLLLGHLLGAAFGSFAKMKQIHLHTL